MEILNVISFSPMFALGIGVLVFVTWENYFKKEKKID